MLLLLLLLALEQYRERRYLRTIIEKTMERS